MRKTHPNAQSLGIASEAVVTGQGDDTAPARSQGHSGHQEGTTTCGEQTIEAIQLGHPVIFQSLHIDAFMDGGIKEDGHEEAKH